MAKKYFQHVLLALAMVLPSICSATPALSPQVAVVAELYKSFAFETAIQEPNLGPIFLNSPRSALLNFLTPTLTDLILADSKCAAETQEICKLNFSPLWDSQDPSGSTVRIIGTNVPSKVKVEVRYSSETRVIFYQLSLTPNGWRIKDIQFERNHRSLAKILGAK